MIVTGNFQKEFTEVHPGIFVMENHDGAHHVWKQRGCRDKILLHFDAHIDFSWITPSVGELLLSDSIQDFESQLNQSRLWSWTDQSAEDRTHLGNYIYQGLKGDIVKEFIWIYPDAPSPDRQARAVERILRNTGAIMPEFFKVKEGEEAGCFEGFILNKPFKALPFSKLNTISGFEESILLNVDTDFFVIQELYSRSYPYRNFDKDLRGWLSPQGLLDQIKSREIVSDCLTLAFSVEEGYTPISLKFLGEEFWKRFADTLHLEEEKAFDGLKESFSLPPQDARRLLNGLIQDTPERADLHFNLAVHLAAMSDITEARTHYWKAVERDESYRSAYNHEGRALYFCERKKEADVSFSQIKAVDPEHPDALFYDIERAAEKKIWGEVLKRVEEARHQGLQDSRVALMRGEALDATGRWQEACASIKNFDSTEEGLGFFRIRFLTLKARLAERGNEIDEAIDAWREIINLRVLLTEAHLRLFFLYFKKGNLYQMKRNFMKGLRFSFFECFRPLIRWSAKQKTYL